MRTRSKIATGAAAIAIVGGVAVAVPALAADTPTPSPTSSTAPQENTKATGGPLETSLDKLVKAGTITQAQAEKITAQVQADRPARGTDGPNGHGWRGGSGGSGGSGGPAGHGGGPGGFGHGVPPDVVKAAASTLKLTEEQLRTKLATQSLGEIADAQTVSRDTLVAAIQKALAADQSERITKLLDQKLGQGRPAPDGKAPDGKTPTAPTAPSQGTSPTATPSASGASA